MTQLDRPLFVKPAYPSRSVSARACRFALEWAIVWLRAAMTIRAEDTCLGSARRLARARVHAMRAFVDRPDSLANGRASV